MSGSKKVSASIHAKASKVAQKKQAIKACKVSPN
jgi:hypothetical protein